MASESLQTRLYNGKELTEPEIELIQYIEKEREKIRLVELEKQQQRVLLAKVGSNKIGLPQTEQKPTPAPTTTTSASEKTQLPPFKKQALISPAAESSKSILPPSAVKPRPFEDALKPTDSEVMDKIEEELGINNNDKKTGPEDIASLFGVNKDETTTITKIKKRDISELENEENISVPTYFNDEGIIMNELWDSLQSNENKELLLPSFKLENNNTIGIKLESDHIRSWAFNICPASDRFNTDILFHFNPRYKSKGKPMIVLNDRQGTWGTGTTEEMRNTQGILAKSIDLKIEIRKEGFLVFANNIFAAFFVHRRDIINFKDLKIVFISKDDNGKEEEVKIFSVWWGHTDFKRETLSPSINSIINRSLKVTYESVTNPLPPRTIVAEGLPKLHDLVELQGLEYSLLDLFEEYKVVRVSLVTGEGIAYILVRVFYSFF